MSVKQENCIKFKFQYPLAKFSCNTCTKEIKSYGFPNAISDRLKSIEPGEEGSWVFVVLKLPSDYVTQAEN